MTTETTDTPAARRPRAERLDPASNEAKWRECWERDELYRSDNEEAGR